MVRVEAGACLNKGQCVFKLEYDQSVKSYFYFKKLITFWIY